MALDHVAQGAGSLIEPGALLDTQVLPSGDLNMVDVIAIPEGFKDSVTEAQHQKILHRVLAEKMIDAIHLLLIEYPEDDAIELPRRDQITPKGLLQDDAYPGIPIRCQ